MTLPLPTSDNLNYSKGLPEVMTYSNSVTNGWLMNMILIAVYILTMMGYYKAKGDFSGGMAISGFAVFIIGLLFWLGGAISGYIFSFTVGIAILGVIVLLLENK